MSSKPSHQRQPIAAADEDPVELIEGLRRRGAARFDPVGFRFIEALAQRAATPTDTSRQLLNQRVMRAITEFSERLDRAEQELGKQLGDGIKRFPQAAKTLRKYSYANDHRGLRHLLVRLEAQGSDSPIGDLLSYIKQQELGADRGEAGTATTELKSIQLFRRTWTKLRADQQLSDAVSQAPKQAGPLNSHALVLQSLKVMRDISPDYFEQITTYLDALLWLEQAESVGASAPKGAGKGKVAVKRRAGRRKGT